MLKFAAQFQDDIELGVVWWGQSNAAPKGLLTDAVADLPELNTFTNRGDDVLSSTDFWSGSGTTTYTAGTSTTITVTSTTMTAGAWVGSQWRNGSKSAPTAGYGTITANTTTTLTITWTVGFAVTGSTLANGYLCWADNRRTGFPGIRILTPYQPETAGAYPAGAPDSVTGFTISADITSYDDLALFLPLSFYEGISGYGFSTEDEVASSATSSTFVLLSSILTADVMAGGRLRVKHAGGTSWSDIGTNDATTFIGLAWTGDGTPSGTAASWTWEAWLPHPDNNYNERLAGFRYPNNEMQPLVPLKSVPSNVTSNVYWSATAARFGAMVAWAWRMANALGRRINVIHLASDSSSIIDSKTEVGLTTIGWVHGGLRKTWNPGISYGLAPRLSRLFTMAKWAIAADGNSKPLKIIAIGGMQGETEATSRTGQALYKQVLPVFYAWLRKVIFDAGISYYPTADMLPSVHAQIPADPWSSTTAAVLLALLGYSTTVDEDGEINAAIINWAAKTPFAGTIYTSDRTSVGVAALDIHFDGADEVLNGTQMADVAITLIEAALAGITDTNDQATIDLCNTALAYVADAAQVTSLDPTVDATMQAKHCARFFPLAKREALQRCAWSFATRRESLDPITGFNNESWPYAYGVPDNAARIFAVLPPSAGDDVAVSAGAAPVYRDGTGAWRTSLAASSYTPKPFTVELDSDGYPIVYSKVEGAVARFNTTEGSPAGWSPLFRDGVALLLASKLAGPMVQGPAGLQLAQQLLALSERKLSEAMTHDGVQSQPQPKPVAPWIAARGFRSGQ